jgi:hypothetical protein
VTSKPQLNDILDSIRGDISLYLLDIKVKGVSYRQKIGALANEIPTEEGLPESLADSIHAFKTNRDLQEKIGISPYSDSFELMTRYAGLIVHSFGYQLKPVELAPMQYAA